MYKRLLPYGSRARKRKKSLSSSEGSGNEQQDEAEAIDVRGESRDCKVIIKLAQDSASFKEWNSVALSKSLTVAVGVIKSASVLRDGSLLVVCKDAAQQRKAIGTKRLGGKDILVSDAERNTVRGVIVGVPTATSVDEVKENLTGVTVVDARRLKVTRFGVRCDSLSVMVTLEGRCLPSKVFIGYMCYSVRPYVPPPLRCFKCQRFGHIAAVCRGRQRCGKCAGDHEYGKCDVGAKLKCCNCGEEHSSAYGGCRFSKRAAEVQKIKVSQGISYADAVKKVSSNEFRVNTERGASAAPSQGEMREASVAPKKCEGFKSGGPKCAGSRINENTLVVDREDFVLFMVDVVNCAAQTQSRTERIRIIAKAAGRFLGTKELDWADIENRLKALNGSRSDGGLLVGSQSDQSDEMGVGVVSCPRPVSWTRGCQAATSVDILKPIE
ncbi:uncharacterized protein [Eucyclogobius newberryi]|uniref:uncharacterized protein n=1 Tax=Eucyclogobius newberryi TaxID=166745 RepID=UPI003B5CF547